MNIKSFAANGLIVFCALVPVATWGQAPPSATGALRTGSYLVNVDYSALTPGSTYTLEYALNDGSMTGDHNTTLTVSGINLGGGVATTSTTAAPNPAATGGASGATGTGVTLTDSGTTIPTADYLQTFTAPNTATKSLSFTINLTQNGNDGTTPDNFAFNLLNADVSALPTADPFGTTLLTINYGATPQYTNYNTNLVTISPEPSAATALLLGAGAVAALATRKRRRA